MPDVNDGVTFIDTKVTSVCLVALLKSLILHIDIMLANINMDNRLCNK